MIARISQALSKKKDGEKGFTLIELLVVIIIIGILAAIAIPVFLSQREKAVDAAAEADLSTIAKQVATAYVDSSDDVSLGIADGHYTLEQGTGGTAQNIGPVSGKLESVSLSGPDTGAKAEDFKVTLTYDGGKHPSVSYDAAGKGLEFGDN